MFDFHMLIFLVTFFKSYFFLNVEMIFLGVLLKKILKIKIKNYKKIRKKN